MDGLVEAFARLERAVSQLERALAAGSLPPSGSRERQDEIKARLDGALETIARALGGEG